MCIRDRYITSIDHWIAFILLGIIGGKMIVESVKPDKDCLLYTSKAKEEMKVYSTALRDILERTTNAFVDGDEALARTVEPRCV